MNGKILIFSLIINCQIAADSLDDWNHYLFVIDGSEEKLLTFVRSTPKDDLFYLTDLALDTDRNISQMKLAGFISLMYVQHFSALTNEEKEYVSSVMINMANSLSGIHKSNIMGSMIKMRNPLILEYALRTLEEDKAPWVQFVSQALIDARPPGNIEGR